jgi:1-acyl-sn-glycerol-3-phosphate acyltransferase
LLNLQLHPEYVLTKIRKEREILKYYSKKKFNMRKNPLLYPYTLYVALVFLIFMIIYSPLIILPLLYKRNGNYLNYYGLKLWAETFRLLTGIWYSIEGKKNLVSGISYIFIPTHTSWLDIPAIPLIANGPIKTLSKKEVGQMPLFGPVARLCTVMVDRSDPKSRRKSLDVMRKALNNGTSLLIYPEGTVNKTAKPLAPFYEGAFRLATQSHRPLVPIVVKGCARCMPPRSLLMRPGKVKIRILPPIDTKSVTPEEQPLLKAKVYDYMEKEVLKLYSEE